jgi:hypothetical protein
MTDSLIPLLQLGGTGAVLLAVVVMGRWLRSKNNTALDSYMTAYGQESARIDARIQHLEKLVEEQARFARTVETIKDDIGAQRKLHDNRWGFRKDVYVRLIDSVVDLIGVYSRVLSLRAILQTQPEAPIHEG